VVEEKRLNLVIMLEKGIGEGSFLSMESTRSILLRFVGKPHLVVVSVTNRRHRVFYKPQGELAVI
jgi:hypothetical protein